MHEVYPYRPRYWYPHMREIDQAIWERFIAIHPDYFDAVQYDVHVGSKPDTDQTTIAATGGDFGNIYQRKIDVVGQKGTKTGIVEVKPRADARALGQVKGYETLYRRDIDPGADTIPIVVTDEITFDMEHLAKEFGIILIKV